MFDLCSASLYLPPPAHDFCYASHVFATTDSSKIWKKIVLSLPLRFRDYNKVIEDNHVSWYYPQGIAFSSDNRYIYISFASDKVGVAKTYFGVYDFKNGKQINFFSAGKNYAESFFIKKSNGKTLLYTSDENKKNNTDLGIYDISNIKWGEAAPLIYRSTVPVNSQISAYKDLMFAVSNVSSAYTKKIELKRFEYYYPNRNFKFPDVVLNFSDLNVPALKRQGIGVGKNFFVASFGGLYRSAPSFINDNALVYNGVIKFSGRGYISSFNICSSKKYGEKLEKLTGQKTTRLENEGVAVDSNNNVYTLVINNTESNAAMFVIQEFIDRSVDSSHYFKCN